MQSHPLGRSGVEVSALGLGVMTFGAQTGQDEAFAQLNLALASGVTLYDAAENYPAPTVAETQGRSEEILGAWLSSRGVRDQIVIATKVTGPRDMAHIRGSDRKLDRANITAAIEASLRRLRVSHIDLYQIHWPERLITTASRPRFVHRDDAPGTVPIAETLAIMDDLVAEGKVRQVGVANETPWGVMTYLRLAETEGLARVVSVQNGYSLLNRTFELALAEVAMREQVGLIAYSPLAVGLLTGKHLASAQAPEDSRLRLFPGLENRTKGARVHRATAAYAEIARRHGLDAAAMALAFARSRPFTTSVLIGASRLSQLENNLASADLELPPAVVKEIDAVHDENPNPFR